MTGRGILDPPRQPKLTNVQNTRAVTSGAVERGQAQGLLLAEGALQEGLAVDALEGLEYLKLTIG